MSGLAVTSVFLPRDAMHKRGLHRCAVSVRLSVTFVYCVKTSNHILENFSSSSSHNILLDNLLKTQPQLLPKNLRFDLYQRPSSEEAGTQFFRFLTQREGAVSRKRSYVWLSW